MHQNAEFTAIKNEVLVRAPAHVQEYVRKFFKRQQVFGNDCWIAFGAGQNLRSYRDNEGIAPGNHRKGLAEEIRELAENPADGFRFHAVWDDGSIGQCDVD
jgi:hypothetical protein